MGIGLWGAPADTDYTFRKDSIPIPILGGDWEYFSIEVPFFYFQGFEEEMSFRLGLNSNPLNYREVMTSVPQTGQQRDTTFEFSTLTLYISYLSEWAITENLTWYYEAGPTIFESVLTEATETFSLSTGSDGSIEKKHLSIQKNYQTDFGIGAMLAVGAYYRFDSSDALGLQLVYFHQPSNLSFSKDDKVNLSNTQLRAFYLFAFD